MKKQYKVKSKLTDEEFFVERYHDDYIYRGELNNIVIESKKIGTADDQPFVFTGINYLRNYYILLIAIILAPVFIPCFEVRKYIIVIRNKILYNA